MKTLEQAAEEYAFGNLDDAALYGCTMSGRIAAFKAGAEWMKKQMKEDFRTLLDKWMEHSIRGMEHGSSVYFQGKICLIVDLLEAVRNYEEGKPCC